MTKQLDPKYFEMRSGYPAINVKMSGWGRDEPLNPRLINYLEKAFENRPQLFDLAFEKITEVWWEERVVNIAEEHGLAPRHIEQEGRSGGWLVYRDRGLAHDLEAVAEQPHLYDNFVMVAKWVAFVDDVEASVVNAAEDMRHEVAWLYAEALDERRERLIEEWDAAHPRLTTRPATADPVFGWCKPSDAVCSVCDGWGWVGHDELVPCPKCERGQENQRPRLGIDVPSPKYELHDVGTEANPYLNVPTVHDWAIAKAQEANDDME